jgi:formate hydrogenlyase subunit 6/NADH:ubiquinone oxidoreductase subunit I
MTRPRKQPVRVQALLALELPALDERRCVGCGLCPAVCPTQCLAMAGPLPWLPPPRDCVSCGLCAAICPAGALEMRPPEW